MAYASTAAVVERDLKLEIKGNELFGEMLAILVGAQVRALRKRRGLSQCELAHRVNALEINGDLNADPTVDPTQNRDFRREHVARIERAVYLPSLQTLSRIARALGVDITTLLACVEGVRP